MASVVDICNLALDELGESPIVSLTDSVTAAERCARRYPHARDLSLAMFDWSFASTRSSSIAASATPPAFGYINAFPVPSSCIEVRELRDAAGFVITNWKQELGYVLTNARSPVFMRYTARVEDPTVWPADFVSAVAYRLAADLAIGTTENEQLRAELLKAWGSALQAAMLFDGKRRSQPFGPDPLATTIDVDGYTRPYVPDIIEARGGQVERTVPWIGHY